MTSEPRIEDVYFEDERGRDKGVMLTMVEAQPVAELLERLVRINTMSKMRTDADDAAEALLAALRTSQGKDAVKHESR